MEDLMSKVEASKAVLDADELVTEADDDGNDVVNKNVQTMVRFDATV